MKRIQVLPDILVKKIAAGEVIERPASVVKELMENAVDAGATRINVAIEDGGRSLIKVTDDGCGMTPDELPLAVTPHATSKISAEPDLYHIASLGFRGEALASIGAVSRLRIVSRTHESDEGGEVIVEGQQLRTSRAAGCPPGCQIEVRDLFFNVPARRKFLRQPATELGHITTQFSRLAMAHPKIAFELTNRNRTTHQLAAGSSRRERIAQLYGRELGDSLIEFHRDEAPVAIEGYAARPADSRSNTNWQFVFVNGRFIRDRYLHHAIREAYRGLIEPNRAAVVFLFLSIDPTEVDVNVHPTKIEVRWQDSNVVHSQVLSALREALRSADLTPALDTSRGWRGQPATPPDPQEQERLRREFAEEMRRTAPPSAPAAGSPITGDRPYRGGETQPRSATPSQGLEVWRAMFEQPQSGQHESFAAPPPDAQEPTPTDIPAGPIRSAIQLHNTYLVCETDDGLVIIDQHALHERVLYNQLKDRITRGKLQSQRLLLPETLHVTPEQLALIDSHAELLDQLGLEFTPFSKDSVAIQSFPDLLKDTDVVGFVRDLLDKIAQNEDHANAEGLIHEALDMMACKAAVKAGDPLTREEIDALISRRDLIEKSSNCPHGRPTALRLTVRDLERQFKRT